MIFVQIRGLSWGFFDDNPCGSGDHKFLERWLVIYLDGRFLWFSYFIIYCILYHLSIFLWLAVLGIYETWPDFVNSNFSSEAIWLWDPSFLGAYTTIGSDIAFQSRWCQTSQYMVIYEKPVLWITVPNFWCILSKIFLLRLLIWFKEGE